MLCVDVGTDDNSVVLVVDECEEGARDLDYKASGGREAGRGMRMVQAPGLSQAIVPLARFLS